LIDDRFFETWHQEHPRAIPALRLHLRHGRIPLTAASYRREGRLVGTDECWRHRKIDVL
jgi:hypothetical protein